MEKQPRLRSIRRFFTGFLPLLAAIVLSLMVLQSGCGKKSAVDSVPRDRQVRILFVGDTYFGESYEEAADLLHEKGFDYPLERLAPLMKDSDYVVADLEAAITDLKQSPFQGEKLYNHRSSLIDAPKHLKKIGVRAVSLANKHSLDFGLSGLEQTLDVLNTHEIAMFGAGLSQVEAARPLDLEFRVGGKKQKIALIGGLEYNKKYDQEFSLFAKDEKGGVHRLSRKSMRSWIKKIKKNDPSTLVVVFPHWGKNYKWKTEKQVTNAHSYIDSGADLVIGHGTHAMQEIEPYKGRWILYGLGNFMFLTPGRYNKQDSVPFSYCVQLILVEQEGTLKKWVRLYPIFSNNRITNYQPHPLDDVDFSKFQQLLFEKSLLNKTQRQSIVRGQDAGGRFLEVPIR